MGNKCFGPKKPKPSPLPPPNPGGNLQNGGIELGNINAQFSGHERPLPSPPPARELLIFKALYDFDAINDDDLSFRKGDKLEVEESGQTSDWWLARHMTTHLQGYIPSNYVCKDDNSVQAQDWWYDVDRKEADKYLLAAGNPTGTYLVRESTDKASYVLSVRDYDAKSNDSCVKHYRLRKMDHGGFYISPKRTMNSIFELIRHYQEGADGLCCRLVVPCPRERPVVQFRELEVARESVKLNNKLGSGCFGDVFAGKWRNTIDVAVKTLKAGTMSPEDFLAEAKIMHKLRHKKLVQLLAVCSKTEPIYIITELMSNGALLDFLHKDEGKTIKFNQVIDMASQVAEGMAYLERQNFVHRDLRAANILVGNNFDCKVADFGLARIIEEDIYQATEKTKFPVKWTAPEAAFDRKFSIKSDVWSFGVLLYELISFGRIPYAGMAGSEVLNKVEKGYRMPKPNSGPIPCPDTYYDVMLKCWNKNPESRPTFEFLYACFDDFSVATGATYD